MYNPCPVPLPGSLVVKKGLKILSCMESGMPCPLSEIETMISLFCFEEVNVIAENLKNHKALSIISLGFFLLMKLESLLIFKTIELVAEELSTSFHTRRLIGAKMKDIQKEAKGQRFLASITNLLYLRMIS